MRIIQDVDFLDYVSNQQSAFVKPAYEFVEGALERLTKGVAVYGDPLPWQKTQDKFRFREGEVTIWAGVNGNGKSLVMGQTAAWLSLHTPIVIASMEMPAEATIARMLRQTSGTEKPSKQFADKFASMTDFNLYIYDQLGTMTPDSIIGMVHYSATQLNAKHIMVDSLVKCGVGVDDYNAQKQFVDALCWAAKEHKIHIHLVHHIRKGNNETEIPDKFAIKGAGEITDLADNVLIVARNMAKEKAKRENSVKYDETQPDGFMRVAKQRHGEWEGMWGFWWHEKSQQWIPGYNKGALPWPRVNYA